MPDDFTPPPLRRDTVSPMYTRIGEGGSQDSIQLESQTMKSIDLSRCAKFAGKAFLVGVAAVVTAPVSLPFALGYFGTMGVMNAGKAVLDILDIIRMSKQASGKGTGENSVTKELVKLTSEMVNNTIKPSKRSSESAIGELAQYLDEKGLEHALPSQPQSDIKEPTAEPEEKPKRRDAKGLLERLHLKEGPEESKTKEATVNPPDLGISKKETKRVIKFLKDPNGVLAKHTDAKMNEILSKLVNTSIGSPDQNVREKALEYVEEMKKQFPVGHMDPDLQAKINTGPYSYKIACREFVKICEKVCLEGDAGDLVDNMASIDDALVKLQAPSKQELTEIEIKDRDTALQAALEIVAQNKDSNSTLISEDIQTSIRRFLDLESGKAEVKPVRPIHRVALSSVPNAAQRALSALQIYPRREKAAPAEGDLANGPTSPNAAFDYIANQIVNDVSKHGLFGAVERNIKEAIENNIDLTDFSRSLIFKDAGISQKDIEKHIMTIQNNRNLENATRKSTESRMQPGKEESDQMNEKINQVIREEGDLSSMPELEKFKILLTEKKFAHNIALQKAHIENEEILIKKFIRDGADLNTLPELQRLETRMTPEQFGRYIEKLKLHVEMEEKTKVFIRKGIDVNAEPELEKLRKSMTNEKFGFYIYELKKQVNAEKKVEG